jgi:hypothetical protein
MNDKDEWYVYPRDTPFKRIMRAASILLIGAAWLFVLFLALHNLFPDWF